MGLSEVVRTLPIHRIAARRSLDSRISSQIAPHSGSFLPGEGQLSIRVPCVALASAYLAAPPSGTATSAGTVSRAIPESAAVVRRPRLSSDTAALTTPASPATVRAWTSGASPWFRVRPCSRRSMR